MPYHKGFKATWAHMTDDQYLAHKRRLRKANTVKMPAFYADNAKRAARLKVIRNRFDMTQGEFAAEMGLSTRYYSMLENGKDSVRLIHLKMAEMLWQRLRKRLAYAERKAELERMASLQLLEIPSATESPAPDDPRLRAEAISMFINGDPEEEIARELALRPEVVRAWISEVDDSE